LSCSFANRCIGSFNLLRLDSLPFSLQPSKHPEPRNPTQLLRAPPSQVRKVTLPRTLPLITLRTALAGRLLGSVSGEQKMGNAIITGAPFVAAARSHRDCSAQFAMGPAMLAVLDRRHTPTEGSERILLTVAGPPNCSSHEASKIPLLPLSRCVHLEQSYMTSPVS
jgi:hypothetical protein